MLAKHIFLAFVLLAGGAALGYGLSEFVRPVPEATPSASQAFNQKSEQTAERKILYWYDPMYPGTQFEKPGKSPFMDMDLVPRYAEDSENVGIRIDPAQVQNLAVRTEKVERGSLSFACDIPANVEFNNYRLAKVQPRAEGFVEKIHSFAVGDAIKQGAPLADITVPAWASDQSEYLLLKNQKADVAIVKGVREKMRLTGMPEEMLAAVDKTGRVQTTLTLKSPVAGIITSLDVYPGMNVGKDMIIATVQGADPVWVTANVPERDIHLVNAKSKIRLTIPAYPEKVFQVESFILLPKADQETRTVPLRLSVSNADGLLRPGMSASIRLRGNGEEALLVPTQSIIDLGHEQRVVTRAADGSFVPKQVQVLRSSREKTAIASGLEVGEDVVVSGLFLIDSEANLRGALERMRKGPVTTVTGATEQDGERSATPASQTEPASQIKGEEHANH